MVKTKEEVENRIGKVASFFDQVSRPIQWVKQFQKFNNSFRKSTSELPEFTKFVLQEKKRELDLYMLERSLIEIEERIKEAKAIDKKKAAK